MYTHVCVHARVHHAQPPPDRGLPLRGAQEGDEVGLWCRALLLLLLLLLCTLTLTLTILYYSIV